MLLNIYQMINSWSASRFTLEPCLWRVVLTSSKEFHRAFRSQQGYSVESNMRVRTNDEWFKAYRVETCNLSLVKIVKCAHNVFKETHDILSEHSWFFVSETIEILPQIVRISIEHYDEGVVFV